MKRISQMSEADKSALKLELRQNSLKIHKRQAERRRQMRQLIEDQEKDDRRLSDIEESLNNLEQL